MEGPGPVLRDGWELHHGSVEPALLSTGVSTWLWYSLLPGQRLPAPGLRVPAAPRCGRCPWIRWFSESSSACEGGAWLGAALLGLEFLVLLVVFFPP